MGMAWLKYSDCYSVKFPCLVCGLVECANVSVLSLSGLLPGSLLSGLFEVVALFCASVYLGN